MSGTTTDDKVERESAAANSCSLMSDRGRRPLSAAKLLEAVGVESGFQQVTVFVVHGSLLVRRQAHEQGPDQGATIVTP